MQIKSLCVLLTILIACAFTSARTVPRIVKVVHLKNQTGLIGPITLYTPHKPGLFRLSSFLVATVGNDQVTSPPLLCESFGFTDSVGSGTAMGPSACLNLETTGNISQEVTIVESVAGAPITLTVAPSPFSGTTTGSFYNVDVVVEELPEVPENEEQ
jgi:hypothetical protein